MKKSEKFKYQLILLFLLSFGISNAQEFFNYNNATSNSSNGAVLKEKIHIATIFGLVLIVLGIVMQKQLKVKK